MPSVFRKTNKLISFIVVCLFFFFILFGIQNVYSTGIDNDVCDKPKDKEEKELCEELEKIREEERLVEGSLRVQKQQSASIQRDLSILTDQIRQAELSIDKKNISIKQLDKDITLKEQTVTQLNEKMERMKTSLSKIISRMNQLDDTSVTEIILADTNFSEFFVEVDNYSTLQNSLNALFDEIREIKGLTEEEKVKLKSQQNKEQDVKAEIVSEKRKVEVKEDEKEVLLSVSKQSEATYENVLQEKRARAAQIRSALFRLRDTDGISFGDAVNFAKIAGDATGVRPSLILAILKQESDLGQNVGRCNLVDSPASKKWDKIMPGPLHYSNYVANGRSCTGAASPCSWRDDQTAFKEITKKLDRDYKNTPLSCPIASVGGWGGAMGPSQFIPTTWNSYKDRISSSLGVKSADPWNPEHAFTATALYMADLGAAYGGYTSEHTAAAKYYAGNNYSTSYGQSYGSSVMGHAATFQEQIDFLNDVD